MPNPEGLCRLCLSHGPLSREHVPPKGAYNSGRMLRSDAIERLRDPGTEAGRILQNGNWFYSFCESCNNLLGRMYVPEYVLWAKHFMTEYRLWAPGIVPVSLHGVYPLRFLKQAVAMIFSVNPEAFTRGFCSLAGWIRDRDANQWHWSQRVYLTLVDGPVGRGWPILHRGGSDPATFTEVAMAPFSVQMVLGEQRQDRPGNITWFARHRFDESVNLNVALPCGSLATAIPADFRAKEEVDRAVAASELIRRGIR